MEDIITIDDGNCSLVEFVRPYNNVQYAIVPHSWIKSFHTTNGLVLVAYPEEDPSITRERVERNEQCNENWKTYEATFICDLPPERNGNSIKDNKGERPTQAQKRKNNNYDQDTPSTSKVQKTQLKNNNIYSQSKMNTYTIGNITNTETCSQSNAADMRSSNCSNYLNELLEQLDQRKVTVTKTRPNHETACLPSTSRHICGSNPNISPRPNISRDSLVHILGNDLIAVQTPTKSKNNSRKHYSPHAQKNPDLNKSNKETNNGGALKNNCIMHSASCNRTTVNRSSLIDDSKSITVQYKPNGELQISESTLYPETSTEETPVEKSNEESHGDKNTHSGNYPEADILQALLLTLKSADIIPTTIKNTKADNTHTPTTSTDTTEIANGRKESTPKHIKNTDKSVNDDRRNGDIKNNYNANLKRNTPLPALSEENDPNNTRWTLRHRQPGPEITELVSGSRVYVSTSGLERILRLAKNAQSLAVLLLREIFSDNALRICSLTGSNGSPRIDQIAKKLLLMYVAVYGIQNDWPVNSKTIINSINNKFRGSKPKDARDY